MFSSVVGTTFYQGDPMGPSRREPLMALDVQNWDVFDKSGRDTYTVDEEVRDKMRDVYDSKRVAWRVSYRSVADDTRDLISWGKCEKREKSR